jgi:hypothetical protein
MPDVNGLVLIRGRVDEIDITAEAAIHVDLGKCRLGRRAGGICSVVKNVQCVTSVVTIEQAVSKVPLDLADVLRGGIVVEAVIAIPTVEVANPSPALDDVVSGIALHRVGSGIAVEAVVATTSVENVVASRTVGSVVASLAAEKVVPRFSVQLIISRPAPNLVVARATVEAVVAIIAVNGVGA